MSTSPKCLSQLIRSKRFAHDTKSWLALCLWKKESALKISNQINNPIPEKYARHVDYQIFNFLSPTRNCTRIGEWASGYPQPYNSGWSLIFSICPSRTSKKKEGAPKKEKKDKKYEFLKKNSQKHKDFQKEKLDLLKQQHQEGMSLMGKNIV